MTRKFAFFGLLASALFLAGCGQTPAAAPVAATPPDTREADTKALRDLEDTWNKEYEAKDAAKIVAHYADDATLMAPGMPSSTGKEAISKVIADMVKDSALSLKFHATKVDVSKSGDIGYTQGNYTMTMTNPATKKPINDKGSYVTVYAKQADGSWKAIQDIATSEVAPK